MEEQQIQEFIHRIVTDPTLRSELTIDPARVIAHGEYSPRVRAILLRLVPCLAFEQSLQVDSKWWHA